MPIVTAPSRGNSNGEVVTEFLDTVSTVPTTYTFQNTQEKLKVKNNGYAAVQVTVNGVTMTLFPTESKEFYGSIDSFIVVSSGGVQSFEVTGSNYKDEELQLTGSNLQENPSATKQGHSPISIAESWELRMARLGLIKNLFSPSAGISLTQATFTNLYTSLGDTNVQRAGYNIIPLFFIISANGPGLAQFEYATEPGGTVNYIQRYLGQAGAWEFNPRGQIKTGNKAIFTAKFKADNATTVGWFNMNYAEVSI